MPQRDDPAGRSDPAERSSKEKAEGSRENVNVNQVVDDGSATADNPMESGSGQVSQPHKPIAKPTSKPRGAGGPGGQSGQHLQGGQGDAGGITNRPPQEEQEEQQDLPPRGQNKGGGHAS